MLGISGDTCLRTLLIHGARAVLSNGKAPPEWALRLAERRSPNVAAVALANKMAHTIWALLAHDRAYQAGLRPPARVSALGEGKHEPTRELAR